MSMEETVLKQIGFLEAEIKVYKALLKLGPSLVSRINKETGIHRTHIYDLLEKLREKGLVSTFIKSGKKHFKASSPNKILDYLKEKQEKVNAILPSFEKLLGEPSEETSVELFKGREGLKTVLQDILKEKKDYCVLGSIKEFESILEFSMPSFLKQVEKLKIKERIVGDKKEKIIKIKTGSYRFLNGEFHFPSSYVVYADKVALFIWNAPYFAIVIQNKQIANTYKNYLEFFWKLAK